VPTTEKTVLLEETDPLARKHIAKVQAEHDAQYLALRRRAQSLFTALRGRTGVHTQEEMEKVQGEASAAYKTGTFLLERLGASRFLDPELACVLIQLRSDLLAGIPSPSAADAMNVDMAILGYRNALRVQSLINSALMETERQLFGQASLESVLGPSDAAGVARVLQDVEQKLVPLLEKCQKMMTRALDRLGPRRRENQASVSVGIAGQVNVTNGG